MTSSSLEIDKRLANVNEHGVVSPAGRRSVILTGRQVIFLCDLNVEFSTRGCLGIVPQESAWTDKMTQ